MGTPVRVALIGCGTVGLQVATALLDPASSAALGDAAGASVELVGIGVARDGVRRAGIDPSLVTTDTAALLATAPDVLVELVGGLGDVEALVRRALEAGTSVVTANKALLAARLAELTALAAAHGADLLYEAAVAGAIPVIRVLRDSLAGQPIDRVLGIVNGTTNFLLTTMAHEGCELDAALEVATALGLAERDPSMDLDGHDAAQKAAILASLAFRTPVTDDDVPRVGIRAVTHADVDAAARMGHVVRLLAVAERVGAGGLSVRVRPAMLPVTHPLASVEGASNAVFVEGERHGPLMLEGQGAGGPPTASAVLGDVVTAARHRSAGVVGPAPVLGDALRLVAAGEVVRPCYLALRVRDRPGVLASVAQVFGEHGVSIRTMEQIGLGEDARLVFMTHAAAAAEVDATVADLGALDAVTEVGAVLQVLDGEGT